MTKKEEAVIAAAIKYTKARIKYSKELEPELDKLYEAVVKLKPELEY